MLEEALAQCRTQCERICNSVRVTHCKKGMAMTKLAPRDWVTLLVLSATAWLLGGVVAFAVGGTDIRSPLGIALAVFIACVVIYRAISFVRWLPDLHGISEDDRQRLLGYYMHPFGSALFYGLIFWAVLIVGYQIVYWLRTEVWISCSLFELLFPEAIPDSPASLIPHGKGMGKFALWLVYPDSWLGLHRIVRPLLEWTPFVVFLLIPIATIANELPDLEERARVTKDRVTKGLSDSGQQP